MIDYTNEPLTYSPAKPQRLAEQPWFKVNTPTTYWIVGQKRSGKGVAIDKFITGWLKAGITILYLHSAGLYENMYLAVNKNCKQRWEEEVRLGNIDEEGKLHCKCYRAIPILVAIPDFIEVNQLSVDRYNGVYWSGFDEVNDAFITCKINERPLRDIDYTKVKKPNKLRKFPLIQFRKFKVPINSKGKDNVTEFRKQFLDMVLEARDTHSPLIHSPSFYPETHHGKVQKYTTIAEMMRYLPEVVEKEFHVLRLDKPREDWTRWEKSHHKIAIVVNEMRKFAPSQRLSGDMESSISKKAWFNYLPESRHYKSFIVGDLQSSADMFVGIRNQDDIRIIKRSTIKLLGGELAWFSLGIDEIRKSKLKKWGYDPEYPNSIPPSLIDRLNQKYPRVSEIPDNYGYVVFGNGEFKLVGFSTPSWHHKSDRDDFYADTGITWEVREKATETEKPTEPTHKIDKDDEMKIIHQMKLDGNPFAEIIQHFIEKEKLAGNLETKWNKENNKNLSYRYNYWLKKSRKKDT